MATGVGCSAVESELMHEREGDIVQPVKSAMPKSCRVDCVH